MRKRYKCGFCGASRVAVNLIKVFDNIDDRVEKYGVSSRTYNNAVDFAQKYNIKKTYKDYREMLEDNQIDFVYISTPVGAHYKNIKDALNHGKSVICEKSFTFQKNEAEELYKLANDRHLVLIDGIWSMYMPWISKVCELIEASSIGKIIRIRSSHGFPEPDNDMRFTKIGGGALYDKGVYCTATSQKILNDIQENNIIQKVKIKKNLNNVITDCELFYKKGNVKVHEISSILRKTFYTLFIIGTKGVIISRYFWSGKGFYLIRWPFEIKKYSFNHNINGYEYQIYELLNRLDNKDNTITSWTESLSIETIRIMEKASDFNNIK